MFPFAFLMILGEAAFGATAVSMVTCAAWLKEKDVKQAKDLREQPLLQ